MSQLSHNLFVIASFALMFSFSANIFASEIVQEDPSTALLGGWQCQSDEGTISLVFQSSNILSFDGEQMSYTLLPGIIRVQEMFGHTDYVYTLNINSLMIIFPEGETLNFTKASGKTPSDPGSQGAPSGGSGNDAQLKNLLISSAWCSFSFSGSSGGSPTHGRTNSSQVRFFSNGTYSMGERSVGYSEGSGGSVTGQTDSGSDGQWEIRQGKLYLSEGFGQLEPLDLRVKYNSNGYPILTADGVEYSQCD
jgi:hypothetical protein